MDHPWLCFRLFYIVSRKCVRDIWVLVHSTTFRKLDSKIFPFSPPHNTGDWEKDGSIAKSPLNYDMPFQPDSGAPGLIPGDKGTPNSWGSISIKAFDCVTTIHCGKVGLKLNVQKTKIMASSPITSWQIDRETVETVADFYFSGLQNHCTWWLQPWN